MACSIAPCAQSNSRRAPVALTSRFRCAPPQVPVGRLAAACVCAAGLRGDLRLDRFACLLFTLGCVAVCALRAACTRLDGAESSRQSVAAMLAARGKRLRQRFLVTGLFIVPSLSASGAAII